MANKLLFHKLNNSYMQITLCHNNNFTIQNNFYIFSK